MRWARSIARRLNFALAGVSNGAAAAKKGAVVHVGSGISCLVGVMQVAVLVTTT